MSEQLRQTTPTTPVRAQTPGAAQRAARRRRRAEALDGYLMLLPTIIGVGLFFVAPLAISLYLSFTNSKLMGPVKIIGLQNYKDALVDLDFREALQNTLIFSVLTMILSIVPALGLAIMLNQKIRARTFFRAVFFLPVVASVIAIGLLWRYLLNLDFGFVNYLLHAIGLPRIEWLTSQRYALLSVILVASWRTIGYNLVIFLGGLQAISPLLYEAASIDGASGWRRFRSITLPMLSPTTFFIGVTTLINSLQAFNESYALGATRSNLAGPADSMLTIVFYLFREGFIKSHMGYASAVAWILFAMIMIITVIQFRVSRRWVNYD